MVVQREVIVDRTGTTMLGMRVSWGGIWAGVLVVLGTLLLLSALGVAIGLSTGADESGALRAGAAVWSGLSLLVALFLGGMVATRVSLVWDRFPALLQGALVWVISLIGILQLGAAGVGMLMNGVLGVAITRPDQMPQPTTSAWTAFLVFALSLIAALIGAAVGRRRALYRTEAAEIRTEAEMRAEAEIMAASRPPER